MAAVEARSDLLDLAQETVAMVARRVANGDCSFHCQLLASKFYEAAKFDLSRISPADKGRIELLTAVLDRCDRAAQPRAAPAMILAQLRVALALMQSFRPSAIGRHGLQRAAPNLRVIQGGLSLTPPRATSLPAR